MSQFFLFLCRQKYPNINTSTKFSDDVNECMNNNIATKRISSNEVTENYDKETTENKEWHEDTKVLESVTQSETDLSHLDELEVEDIVVFRPPEEALPATPIKRKSASFKWKFNRKTNVRTKRLYGTSGVESARNERDSNCSKPSNINFCFVSTFHEPPPNKSSFAPTSSNFSKLKPVGHKFRRNYDRTFPELPSSSTLQHLVKGRPKRRKKYAPFKSAVLI